MLSLIDELDDLLQQAIHVPGSSKVLVDETAMRQIIEQLRLAVPDEVRLGQRIAGERERILADAQAQANRILAEAQAQLNKQLDDHAIVQAAHQRAKEIQQVAEQRAASLRADADQYVIRQLNAFEVRLQRLLREVQAGQRALAKEPRDSSENHL